MNEGVSSVINDLIETLKDGESGFKAAAADVTRPDLKVLFQEYSAQRAQFAHSLQSKVEMAGEEAEDSGSVAGAVHRGWMNLKSAMSSRDDIAILEECERGEDSAVKAYREALAEENLGAARSIVEDQYTHVLAAHDRVRGMRDSLKQLA